MLLRDWVKKLQRAMNAAGAQPPFEETGDFGPRTERESEQYEFEVTAKRKEKSLPSPTPEPLPGEKLPAGKSANPAYNEAKKYAGKGENDKGFVAFVSKFWPKAKLPNYKTIIGSSFAWCALWIIAMNTETGLSIAKLTAAARSGAIYGQQIDWQKNGIPRGAVMHLNHSFNCKSGSNNHVTMADGDCAPQDVIEMTKGADGVWKPTTSPAKIKKGATIAGFGGNQGNMVKRSIYDARKICAVRWPDEIALPAPVTKSVDCTGKASSGESTR